MIKKRKQLKPLPPLLHKSVVVKCKPGKHNYIRGALFRVECTKCGWQKLETASDPEPSDWPSEIVWTD